MGRARTGLDGEKIKKKTPIDNLFEELTEEPKEQTKNTVQEDITEVKEETSSLEPKDDKETELEDKINNLPKIKETNTENEIVESPLVKNGRLMVSPSKPKQTPFATLNKNGKYNLVKKNWETKKQLKVVTKTFSLRPDLRDILLAATRDEKNSSVYGLQGAVVQNALIRELVRLQILEEDSLTELIEFK